jgi:hypothetical protein
MARKRIHNSDNLIIQSMTNKFVFLFVARKSRIKDQLLIQIRVTINGKRCTVGTSGVKCKKKAGMQQLNG